MISPAAMGVILLIRVYQYLFSPLLPASCRYLPTCSAYAIEAVRRFGAVRGGWLVMCRLARCHPWGDHGYDPVPKQWPSFPVSPAPKRPPVS